MIDEEYSGAYPEAARAAIASLEARHRQALLAASTVMMNGNSEEYVPPAVVPSADNQPVSIPSERITEVPTARPARPPFRVRYDPLARRLMRRWRLDDETLVSVYVRFQKLGENPSLLRRAYSPFDGMVYSFSFVDWRNRLCEHRFLFQLLYGDDEQSLVVASGIYSPRFGYF